VISNGVKMTRNPLYPLSIGQCYLYCSCAVWTVLLIKYKIINLVHKLKFSSFMRDKQGKKKSPLFKKDNNLIEI
jgi:hypothetical protein